MIFLGRGFESWPVLGLFWFSKNRGEELTPKTPLYIPLGQTFVMLYTNLLLILLKNHSKYNQGSKNINYFSLSHFLIFIHDCCYNRKIDYSRFNNNPKCWQCLSWLQAKKYKKNIDIRSTQFNLVANRRV